MPEANQPALDAVAALRAEIALLHYPPDGPGGWQATASFQAAANDHLDRIERSLKAGNRLERRVYPRNHQRPQNRLTWGSHRFIRGPGTPQE